MKFLEGITEFETRWIGWAGVNVTDEIGQKSLTESLAKKVDSTFQDFVFSFYYLLLYI